MSKSWNLANPGDCKGTIYAWGLLGPRKLKTPPGFWCVLPPYWISPPLLLASALPSDFRFPGTSQFLPHYWHFVRDFILIKDDKQDVLRVFLNYDFEKNPVIHGIDRISTPGRRLYVAADRLPRVLNGMGIAILTTSKGVVSNKKAKSLNVGGEVLCHVW